MPEPVRRVAVLTHRVAEFTRSALADLAALRDGLGIDVVLPPDEVAKHPEAIELGFRAVGEDQLGSADLCLVFGGDGTILRALGRLLGTLVPTAGINFGTVGFLACMPRDQWADGLADILGGRYTVVELQTVEARFAGRTYLGVNDVLLTRIEPRGVLHLEYAISGAPIGDMRCDGMIIASPAGSTAYNLSCGGPVVVWDASALVLNFVAPHSLGFRPMVLRPDHMISVRNCAQFCAAEVMVDGRVVGTLGQNELIEIGTSAQVARLVQREGGSFYRNVEEKLFGMRSAPDAG